MDMVSGDTPEGAVRDSIIKVYLVKICNQVFCFVWGKYVVR